MSSEERLSLSGQIARLERWRQLLFVCVAPTLILAMIISPLVAQDMYGSAAGYYSDRVRLFLTAFTLSTVSVSLEVWVAYRYGRHMKLLTDDRDNGEVSVFRGVLSERHRLEPTQQVLLNKKLLRIEQHRTQTIELLSKSGFLWNVNGRSVRRMVQPALTEVAVTPAFASIAAQWLEEISRHDQAILYGGQRELSDHEKRELGRLIRRLITRPVTSSLPVALLSLVIAINMYLSHDSDNDLMFGFFLIGGIANIMMYIVQVRQAKRFGNDLKVGYVGIRRIGRQDLNDRNDAPLEPDIEFLPVTGMLWTKSGEPAVWRRGST